MLEKINLNHEMTDTQYKEAAQKLRIELSLLQHQVKDRKLPVIVVFEGWGTAGKGVMISQMIRALDPRCFKVFSTVPPNAPEKRKPFLWRHWERIPERGRFAIFDRSWYPEASIARIEEELGEGEARQRIDEINTFERQLTDEGYLIVKFFLHMSQKEQEKRLEKLAANKSTAWRATERDWKRNRQYKRYYRVFDEMLEHTHTSAAPWHIIPAHDKNVCMAQIFSALVDSIQQALEPGASEETIVRAVAPAMRLAPPPPLVQASMELSVEREPYEQRLKKLQKRLASLHGRLYHAKVPVVVVYEGWDAAGKGGNIRRLVKALDPRGYEVIPVAAPSPTELAHHYLWRFWTQLPKDGHIAIFDRSWYGRVMVERIEGFCPPQAWERAFGEINEFEKQLHDWGAVVVKFWLQIDQDEQLRRFTDRQNTPEKQWKITDEDWRNRKKWDLYEEAVADMLAKTSTEIAPWTIIESQDKCYGRLKAIETFIDAVEKRL